MSDNLSMANFGNSFEKSNKEKIIKNPTVSVITLVYNHQNTIKQCLDSILAQQTDFGIELIIGEDCSVDSSMEIISEYLDKYPEIIRVITAEKNVGMMMNFHRCENSCRGKYIAICEGDDFWTNPDKLQKQVEYMENHSECSLCFHSHSNLYDDGTMKEVLPPLVKDIYTIQDILLYDGSFMATCSMIYRCEFVRKYPQWVIDAPVGDAPTMLYCAFNGHIKYIPHNMAVYRSSNNSAWSQLHKKNISFTIHTYQRIVKMYKQIDKWSQYKYHSVIRKKICKDQKFIIKMMVWKYTKINLFKNNSFVKEF